jgi:hypothetical protein
LGGTPELAPRWENDVRGSDFEDVEQLFCELELGEHEMVALGPAPRSKSADASERIAVSQRSTRDRVVVESLPETEWPDES